MDEIDKLLTREWNREGEPSTVLLKFPFDEERVEALLSLPSVTSVILYQRCDRLIVNHPDRIGWCSADGAGVLIPRQVARKIILLGPDWDLGIRATSKLLFRGVRWAVEATDSKKVAWLGLVFEELRALAERMLGKTMLGPVLEMAARARALTARSAIGNVDGYAPVSRRILFVTGSLGPGGSERQLVNTLSALSRRGYADISLLVERPLSPPCDFYLSQVEGLRVKVASLAEVFLGGGGDGHEAHDFSGIRRVAKALGLPSARVVAYAKFIREEKPEVVHAWLDEVNVNCGIAAALVGAPRIVLGCRSLSPRNFSFFRSYFRRGYKILADLPNVVVLNNSQAGAIDYGEWLSIDVGRSIVVPNIVYPDLLRETGDPAGRFAGPEAKVVGTVMRFSNEKQPLLWIEAMRMVREDLPNTKFLMIGDGPMLSEARQSADDLVRSEALLFTGTRSDVYSLMGQMDVFVLCSKVEGLPNVLIEAQAAGTPVVSLDAGGSREAFEDGETGLLVSSATASDLAGAVVKMLKDERFQKPDVSVACRELVRNRFSEKTVVEKIVQAYGDPKPSASLQ